MPPKLYKSCLLIDDNFIDNFVTRKIIESSNFADEVFVYESATEAIEQIRLKKIKPEVIFLDIRMPTMDGFEFLKKYALLDIEDKDRIKIYMLSSSLDPVDFRLSTENQYITQFIHKPITYKLLDSLRT